MKIYSGDERIESEAQDSEPIEENEDEEDDDDEINEKAKELLMNKRKKYDLRREDTEVLSERFSPEELRTVSGIHKESEAILQRGDDSSTSETTSSLTGDTEKGKRQEQQLELWTKDNGLRRRNWKALFE